MEIQEIIRRWQAGDSQRKIALGTGLSRDTIPNAAGNEALPEPNMLDAAA